MLSTVQTASRGEGAATSEAGRWSLSAFRALKVTRHPAAKNYHLSLALSKYSYLLIRNSSLYYFKSFVYGINIR